MDKLDELWKEQEQLIEDVDFVLEAFKEGTAIFKDVTKNSQRLKLSSVNLL